MAKKKNKKAKKSPLYKVIKPLLNDNRILLAVLGAAAAGVALAAAIGSDKGKQVIDSLGDSVKDLMNQKNASTASTNPVAKKPSPAPAT